MILTPWQTVAIIAVCALCTLLERAFPFLVFRGKAVPERVKYLGRVLPMAIMMSLVVYCLRDCSTAFRLAPQLISCAVTVGLHLWKRNTFLSIGGGTVCCMLLSQLVFV